LSGKTKMEGSWSKRNQGMKRGTKAHPVTEKKKWETELKQPRRRGKQKSPYLGRRGNQPRLKKKPEESREEKRKGTSSKGQGRKTIMPTKKEGKN